MKRILSVNFLIELIIIGLIIVSFGILVRWIMNKLFNTTYQKTDDNFLLTLFLTGVIAHLFFEITGVNYTYCLSYTAQELLRKKITDPLKGGLSSSSDDPYISFVSYLSCL